MTTPEDDFDLAELKGALDRATPRPDPAVRAAHLRLAQENFDRLHAAPARAVERRGGWTRLRGFLGSFAHPGAATGATAVAALALLMVTPAGQGILRGPLSVGEADRPVAEGARPEDRPAEAAEEAPLVADSTAPAADAVAPQEMAEAAPAAPNGAEARLAPPPAAPEVTALAEAGPAAAPTAEAYGGAAASTERAAGPDALASAAAPEREATGGMGAADAALTAQALAPEDGDGESPDGARLGDMVALAPAGPQEDAAVATARVTADVTAPTDRTDPGAVSWAALREAVLDGVRPLPGAVDVQELVDHLAAPAAAPVAGGATLRPSVSVLPAPWDPSARLVVVFVQAAAPVEGAELVLDGAAALGGPEGAVPLGALEAGESAVRVLEPGAALPGPLRLRWTDPATGQRREAKAPVTEGGSVPAEARFAAAVAGWALLLREGTGRLGGWGPAEAAALAEGSLGEDPAGLRAEAVELMRLSDDLVP